MNTTINTKAKAREFGQTASVLAVLALIVISGMLAAALYVSTPQFAEPRAANNAAASNVTLDQHEHHAEVFAAAYAANAMLQQRRGEWDAGISLGASEKRFPGKEKDDLGIGTVATADANNPGAMNAPLEQRRSEWAEYGK